MQKTTKPSFAIPYACGSSPMHSTIPEIQGSDQNGERTGSRSSARSERGARIDFPSPATANRNQTAAATTNTASEIAPGVP